MLQGDGVNILCMDVERREIPSFSRLAGGASGAVSRVVGCGANGVFQSRSGRMRSKIARRASGASGIRLRNPRSPLYDSLRGGGDQRGSVREGLYAALKAMFRHKSRYDDTRPA